MDPDTSPSPEQAAGEASPQVAETSPEPTEDELLSQAYDSAHSDEEPHEEGTVSEAPDSESDGEAVQADAVEEQPQQIEVPTYIPSALKEKWAEIPESVRPVLDEIQKDYHAKSTQQGREIAALNPIKNALTESIQHNPQIANMSPDEMAQQIPYLVSVGQQMARDPVNTLLTLADQHGVTQIFADMVAGQQPQEASALKQEIAQLQQQIRTLTDPQSQRQNYDTWNRETQAQSEVDRFASEAEHWSQMEPYLPKTIPLAQQKLGEGAPARAVLETAYELAIQTFAPELAKKPEPAVEAKPATDPEKVQAALKAKSVNVQGKATGKPKPMTEDEALSAAFDRAMRA